MRQNITLYIDGQRADCDSGSLILMNYTREELENPTIVRNSYSQSVTLPATATNNKIFSHYYRNDYATTGGNFSALVRVPFLLQSDTGEVLERGYLRLVSVAYTGALVHSYSIQLYGGLGGFFYGLAYKADGSQETLADIAYGDADDNYIDPRETTIELTAETIADAWGYLDGDTPTNKWVNFLNFAPCYNGIPDDFDADKILVDKGQYLYINQTGSASNKNYPYPSTNAYRVNMGGEHTEWEMRDLRAYLQRPVLNVGSVLDALRNVQGGIFDYSSDVAGIANALWLTLPLPPRADDYTDYEMAQLLEAFSPADVLLGLAKMYGLMFTTDPATGDISLMTRNEFYDTGLPAIDLTGRIDMGKGRTIVPYLTDTRYYDMQAEGEGAFVDEYAEKYGRVYGSQRIDTGYEFETTPKVLTDGIVFKGAAQFLESSALMQMFYAQGQNIPFPPVAFEEVTFTGFSQSGSESEDNPVPPYIPATSLRAYYNEDYPKYDFFDKPQFCDSEGKPTDGSGVLLFMTGMVEVPEAPHFTEHEDFMQWHLTDDDTALLALLNDGTPCWDGRESAGVRVYSLPQFSRWEEYESLDYGMPKEIATPMTRLPDYNVYGSYWGAYLRDRYHKDSRVLKCSCDLRGLGDIASLLRRFFYYDGSLWSLNKIGNHSLTTLDLTECEFVRVQDTEAYTNGQII